MPQESSAARPVGHLRLAFASGEAGEATASSLSAVEQIGPHLFLCGDETAAIERLTTTDFTNFAGHRRFALGGFFKLPGGDDGEADLEGLAHDGDDLWVMGSHSWRRGKPNLGADGAKARKQLGKTDRQPNRFLLGRVALKAAADANTAEPRKNGALCLPFDEQDGGVAGLLRDDKLLAPFLDLPSKDNGFDLEGLAAKDGVVYLGLRGPVLRGWASVLQLHLKPAEPDGGKGRPVLKARKHDGTGRRYLHHVLDLDGLGIRDLCAWGDDILVLAGPTMDLDGPISVFRWRDAFGADPDLCIDGSKLQRCFDIPSGIRADHAEGITLFQRPGAKRPSLLVVYDSPAASRRHAGSYFEADLFELPE
jgi:Protein of unknown function (DUF3616)